MNARDATALKAAPSVPANDAEPTPQSAAMPADGDRPRPIGSGQPHAYPDKVHAAHVWGYLAMVFGMFMAILDIQIVSSSISEIQAGLSASADEIAWVQTSYLIAEVIMIPLSGYLSRLLSTRVLFVLSALGFTGMSMLCATATSLELMIVYRALQGFLGGAMIPTVFATSYLLFPPQRRAGISVIIGLVATLAPTIGPTLGGYLTEAISWHWLFLINVVPGLLVAAAVWSLLDIDKPDWHLLKGFDTAGIVLMAAFLGSLEFVMEEGPRKDWFSDDYIAVFAVVCAVAAVGFFARVLTYRNPIVDMRAYADRNFAVGSVFSFVIGVGLYGAVYVMPLFLARVRGYNSLEIGLTMFVTGAFQFLSAPAAGFLARRIDLRLMLGMGITLFGLGLLLNANLTNQTAFWELFLPQAVRGASLMFCFVPINILSLGTLPPEKLKNAAGLYNLTRNLGGAIGLAGINTVLTDRMALHASRLSDWVNSGSAQVQAWLDAVSARLGTMLPDGDLAALKLLSNIVQREAQVLTFNDVLIIMAALFFAALLALPLVRKPKLFGADAH
jgi:DHA2 family multidrug resistance protein